ncbi:PHP domain-containing protein, partial [Candidatus Sumerlaeota bacterium]|nr:PHP domain-containing protein [Candidatus Sumerlaeota bacterium]
SMTPAELVAEARQSGLAAIALADHDTCEGVAEFVTAGKELGVETLGGVEISVEFGVRTVHILGYGVDPGHEPLNLALEKIVSGRNERNARIIGKLRMLGVRIALSEVEAVCGEKVVGRPHIAQVLVRKGVVGSAEEAFDRYLARGRPAYCERYRLRPEEAIALISEAGGLAALAHPYYMGMATDLICSTLSRLKQAGLAGIEAYYSEHTEEQTRLYLEMAKRFDLLVTGGTDFHGQIKPAIAMGRAYGSLRIPYELYERLREALAQQRANRASRPVGG